MIRTASSKPKISFIPGSNDMSHYSPSTFSVTNWWWMGLEDFMAKKEFADFNLTPHLSKEEIEAAIRYSTLKINKKGLTEQEIKDKEYAQDMAEMLECPYSYRMKQLIKKSGGNLLWQYDATNKDLTGYIRQVTALGQKSMVRLSWFDCNIKLPILEVFCNLLNKTLYFKRKKEIADWDKVLDNIHKKVKEEE